MQKVQAKDLKPGDIIVFTNPRYNERVVDVWETRTGEVLIHHDFGKGWSIGCDFKNGAIIQITRDHPAGTYRHIALSVFSYATAEFGKNYRTYNPKINGYRTWINFGWKQGWSW